MTPRLIERQTHSEEGAVSFWDRYAANPPRRTLVDEIVENLRTVFSARSGFSSARPDFGLASFFAKQGSRDMLLALRDEMLALVEKEEPRLKDPELTIEGRDNKLMLHLMLSGLVAGKPQRLRILFDTMLYAVQVEAVK